MGRKKFDRKLIPAVPNLEYEKKLWDQGKIVVGGIDEAGRGALAGPVYVGLVILPNINLLADVLANVRDSKELPPKKRFQLEIVIKDTASSWAVASASSQEIDSIGIISGIELAIRRAILNLEKIPDHLLVDALKLKSIPIPQTSLIKGDARCLSIAAASILAKTARDRYMMSIANDYPGYAFSTNKGYGTQKHIEAIEKLGPTRIHRMSFSPLRPRLF